MKSLKRRRFLKILAAGGAGFGIVNTLSDAAAKLDKNAVFTVTEYTNYKIYTGCKTSMVIQFAAQELQKYIRKISGISLKIESPPILENESVVMLSISPSRLRNYQDTSDKAKKLREDGFIIQLTHSGGFTSVYQRLSELKIHEGEQVIVIDPIGASNSGEITFS